VTFEAAGLVVEVTTERTSTQLHITSALLERWFASTATTTKERPTYAQHLARFLTAAEVRTVQDLFTRFLLHQTVTWSSTIAFVEATALT
jgi:putative ATPase